MTVVLLFALLIVVSYSYWQSMKTIGRNQRYLDFQVAYMAIQVANSDLFEHQKNQLQDLLQEVK